MTVPAGQHLVEIEQNRAAWRERPLLQEIYRLFYARILEQLDQGLSGRVLEIGSGIGNLKAHLPDAICTDLFANPSLDLVCDGYDLPFRDGSLSHLLLFDVFHHLQAPGALLKEARRALQSGGRLILFEPYISLSSWPAYGMFHHEPVAWGKSIDTAKELPRPRGYYAAQGNATRMFFRGENPGLLGDWKTVHAEAFASFSYLLSGGFSKPPLYPASLLPMLQRLDAVFSLLPGLFAGRCLVVLTPR